MQTARKISNSTDLFDMKKIPAYIIFALTRPNTEYTALLHKSGCTGVQSFINTFIRRFWE